MTVPAPILTGQQRARLRGLAHPLEPVVHVGTDGVSDGVLAEVEQALVSHELIKVRLHAPEDKRAMARDLAERTGSGLCGLLGHTVVLYRPRPEKPRIRLDDPGPGASRDRR